jgi:predicted dehydrogenase
MPKPLTMVGVGCGGRTRTYCGLAARQPHRYRVVAAADPNPARLEQMRALSLNPDFRGFRDDAELFAAGKLADLCVIGTQDNYHVQPAIRAMELGYDLLLEKPIADNPGDILRLLETAERLGRKVLVCHVLRYGPFFVKVKEIVDSGILGDLVAIDAREGVGPWHQAHSYVRGHWAVTGKATPMLIAKSCHDLDIISWLAGRPCHRVSSYGTLSHFTAANAPAGAPGRCTDGCPADADCPYNAMLYASRQRSWLQWVMDGGATATEPQVREWLTTSPWGRCAYRCDNDAVDHQVVAMEFEGGAVATFTMTAFDYGRHLVLCGTKGTLRGGDAVKAHSGHDIIVQLHAGDTIRYGVSLDVGGYEGHGGADPGLVQNLDRELAKPAAAMRSGLHASVESHMMGYAAERSRHAGQAVDVRAFRQGIPALDAP